MAKTTGELIAEKTYNFVKKWLPAVEQYTAGTPILPELVFAVAVLESRSKVNGIWTPAESKLAREANNIFGIKAGGNWKGEVYRIKTTEYIGPFPYKSYENFRKYPSKSDSFQDFVNLLMTAPRYALVRAATTLRGQAEAMQAAGYATDPAYATKVAIVGMQVQNAFDRLDREAKKPKTAGAGAILPLLIGGGLIWYATQ